MLMVALLAAIIVPILFMIVIKFSIMTRVKVFRECYQPIGSEDEESLQKSKVIFVMTLVLWMLFCVVAIGVHGFMFPQEYESSLILATLFFFGFCIAILIDRERFREALHYIKRSQEARETISSPASQFSFLWMGEEGIAAPLQLERIFEKALEIQEDSTVSLPSKQHSFLWSIIHGALGKLRSIEKSDTPDASVARMILIRLPIKRDDQLGEKARLIAYVIRSGNEEEKTLLQKDTTECVLIALEVVRQLQKK